jgi:hypothetical protein
MSRRTGMALPLGEAWRELAARNQATANEREPLRFDNISIGQRFGPVVYEVDAGTLARYGEVIGTATPLYPTVPARHTAMLRDTFYRLDPYGINAKEEMELSEPACVGDVFTVTGVVVDKYIRRDKPYIITIAETRNQDGRLVERLRKAEMRHKGEEVARKWSFLQEPRS